MSTTLTALFDSRADAEAAKARLQSARVDADHVHIHDRSSAGYREDRYSTHEDRGFWETIKNAFLPDEDRHAYEEGVRRGGVLLTADVDEDCVDAALRILDDANAVDLEDRSQQWRASGWDYQASAARTSAASNREQAIPVVEEELVVGKREVNRGGVRVRSYVTETPVHEQVRLRNERVRVERRAVGEPVSAADEADAFRERTVEVTAHGEEAVVGKTARVVEEVVVSKSADEHVEHVEETVRRTEVDVDRDGAVEGGVNPRR